MEALCPDCSEELTPSIVGYLCHNCGSVHQFDKISKQQKKHNDTKDDAIETSTKSSHKSSQNHSIDQDNEPTQSSSRLRSLFVPRISSKNATTLNSKK